MNEDERPTLLFVEHVLWHPGDDWEAAVTHLAARFSRAAIPLDDAAIRGAGAFADQLATLHAWADAASVDLDRELGRWFDEHLSLHVRPTPVVTRAVRALAAAGPVHAVSALPARAAESITRHAGCWRSVAVLHGDVHGRSELEALATQLRPCVVVAAMHTPMPPGVEPVSLADA